MRLPLSDFLPPIRSALTRHPSPQDAASVVANTAAGAFVTVINAVFYILGDLRPDSVPFLMAWGTVTLGLAGMLARRSHLASGRVVDRVSPRAARKLRRSAVIFALPWAVLPVYVIGLHGPGEPLVVLLICTGMLTGGAFMLHRAFVAAMSYKVTILAAVILSFHLGGWPQAWLVTGYALVYGTFLAYFAFQVGETARERDASLQALQQAVDSLREARDENHRLATVDVTTGLLNRKAFNEALALAVDQQRSHGGRFAVLMIDLDRFKNVNDLFGHGVGDELLAEIGRRLRAGVAAGDTVARLGGDEFAIILAEVGDAAAIRQVAARLIGELNRPARLAGRQIHPGGSVGAVLCPDDAADAVDLRLRADLALNRAKDSGRGQCVTFDETLRRRVVEDDAVEAGLRVALERGDLYVEYQPRIALANGEVLGAEALVRWRDEGGRQVPPETFLAIAAERGLLPVLSRQIAERVAADIQTWRRAGRTPGQIALNLHPDDVKAPELLLDTIAMFEARGIAGGDLVLEITEGCLVGRGTDRVAMLLDGLADRGYRLSLDDFGTGHASLSLLKRIPVSELKIDRSFVAGIGINRNDRAIVAAIAEIARGMGIASVAEGVETEAQRRILAELGVDAGQGYLWSRPVAAARFAEFLGDSLRSAG